jgi:hypothetical protein
MGMREFRMICDLLHASAKGPPDVGYLLLALAVGVHSNGVKLRSSIARDYTKSVVRLLHERVVFVTFENDQHSAKQYLIQFEGLFGHQPSPPLPDNDHNNWGIDIVLRWLDNQEFIPWSFGPVVAGEGVSEESDSDSDHIDEVGLSKLAYGPVETDEVVLRLAALFTSWPCAYDACKEVWKSIQAGELISAQDLVNYLPVTYATFLCQALRAFSGVSPMEFE